MESIAKQDFIILKLSEQNAVKHGVVCLWLLMALNPRTQNKSRSGFYMLVIMIDSRGGYIFLSRIVSKICQEECFITTDGLSGLSGALSEDFWVGGWAVNVTDQIFAKSGLS